MVYIDYMSRDYQKVGVRTERMLIIILKVKDKKEI